MPELAVHPGCTVEGATEALDVGDAHRPRSIHVPLSGGDGLSLEEQLPTAGYPVHSFELRQTVRSLVASLPERERMVIRLRFYDELTKPRSPSGSA